MTIKPRDLRFGLEAELARDWLGGDWFRTAFFNAMSILFPNGEKSFIDSVRANEHAIVDPRLKADVRGFIAQEYVHRREHQRFNELLCRSRRYDLERLESVIAEDSSELGKLEPLFWLATTVAYEHFTATFAGHLLREDGWLEGADPAVGQVWRWHAVEEIEHKAVAFDVYKAAGGTHAMLRKAIIAMTIEFLFRFQLRSLWLMYRRDRPPLMLTLHQAARFLFGKGGFFRANWRHYWAFFRRDFHPDHIDDRKVLADAIKHYGLAHAA